MSYLIEPISGCLHKRKGYNKYPYLEWTANSTLQLQRLAHEELGFGTWSEGTETIPVTKPGQLLGSLDISDPKHPILRRPADADSASLTAGSSAETPLTVVRDETEHTDVPLATPNGASDGQHGVNMVAQNDPTSVETSVERRRPNTDSETEFASSSLPLEQIAQPANSERLVAAQHTTETLIVDSAGLRTQV